MSEKLDQGQSNLENVIGQIHLGKEEIADIENKAHEINEKIIDICKIFNIDTSKFTLEDDQKLREKYIQAREWKTKHQVSSNQGASDQVAFLLSDSEKRGYSDEFYSSSQNFDEERPIFVDREYPLPYENDIIDWMFRRDGELTGLGHHNVDGSYQGFLRWGRHILTEPEASALFEITNGKRLGYFREAEILRARLAIIYLIKLAEKINDPDLNGVVNLILKNKGSDNFNGDQFSLKNYIGYYLRGQEKLDPEKMDMVNDKLSEYFRIAIECYKAETVELNFSIRGAARVTAYLSGILGQREGYLVELFKQKHPALHDVTKDKNKYEGLLVGNQSPSTVIETDPSFVFTDRDKQEAERLNLPWSRIEEEKLKEEDGPH